MTKRIDRDGKSYRTRRGRLVEIPQEWVGHVAHPQTINKRRSKQTRQERSEQSHPGEDGKYFTKQYRKSKADPEMNEEETRELDELYGLDGWGSE